MQFEILGNPSGKTLLLVHGMATTGHKNYDCIIPALWDYCIILCNVDGHYKNSVFSSVDGCCVQIEDFVKRHCGGRLYGALGFSLGGSIVVRLMDRNKISIERVILDAPFCVKMGALRSLYREMFAWSINRITKGRFIPKFMIESVMGKGNSDIIKMFYMDMTPQNARNVCDDVYRFEVSDELDKFAGRVTLWCGSNEPYPKKSYAVLKEYLPYMEYREYPGMGHGQYLNEFSYDYGISVAEFLA